MGPHTLSSLLKRIGLAGTVPVIALVSAQVFSQSAEPGIAFTAEQVANGKQIYRDTCQMCHGSKLSNGQFGTPLKGGFFHNNWKGKSLGELVQNTYEKMPPDNVKSMSLQQYAEVLAFILSNNDIEPGETPIEADLNALNNIPLPW